MNLSELHKLPDLLVVQRTVLSVVLADEVLEDTQCKISYCALETKQEHISDSTILLIKPKGWRFILEGSHG